MAEKSGRGRLRGWLTVGAVSIVANVTWFAAGRKFPNGPIGQLNARLLSRSTGGASTPTTGS